MVSWQTPYGPSVPGDDGVADDHAPGNTVYVEVTGNENQETVATVKRPP